MYDQKLSKKKIIFKQSVIYDYHETSLFNLSKKI